MLDQDDVKKLEERLKRYEYAKGRRLEELKGKADGPEKDVVLRKIKAKVKRLQRRIEKIRMHDPAYALQRSQKKLEVVNKLRDALTKQGLKMDSPRVHSLGKKIKSLNKKIKRLNKVIAKVNAASQPAQPAETAQPPEAEKKS